MTVVFYFYMLFQVNSVVELFCCKANIGMLTLVNYNSNSLNMSAAALWLWTDWHWQWEARCAMLHNDTIWQAQMYNITASSVNMTCGTISVDAGISMSSWRGCVTCLSDMLQWHWICPTEQWSATWSSLPAMNHISIFLTWMLTDNSDTDDCVWTFDFRSCHHVKCDSSKHGQSDEYISHSYLQSLL